MSDTGSNDPYDPDRPSQPAPGTPPPPPAAPQWGSNPPAAPDQPGQAGGAWTGGQLSGQQFGQPAYGQPAYGQQYGQPAGSPPPNYLVWAIVSTVLCCLPLGIASIVFAAQVNGKYASGDVAGAQQSSAKAKKFAIWSAVVGLVLGILYVVVSVLIVVGSDPTS